MRGSKGFMMVLVGLAFLACPVGVWAEGGVTVQAHTERAAKISFDFKDADVSTLIEYIGEKSGRNIIIQGDIPEKVTLRLVDVPWRRALDLVVQQFHGVIQEEGPDILRISKPEMVTCQFKEAQLREVVNIIARLAHASVVTGPEVKGTVNAQFYKVPWSSALNYVVKTNGFVILQDQDVMQVVDPRTLESQLVTRVFQLRYLQPPDAYRAKIDSQFAEKVSAGGAGVAGVSGAGEVMGIPLPTAGGIAGSRAQAAAAREAGSATASSFKLLEALRTVASTKGRIDYVDTANALIVTDTEPNVKAIAELLEALDVEPLQAFIDVKFITTDVTNRFRFGVNWANGLAASNSMGSVMTKLPFGLGDNGLGHEISVTGKGVKPDDVTNAISDTSRSGPFEFGILDFSSMTQAMDFFSSDQGSDIQQAPKLLVLDNEVATIFVGDTIRFAETDSASNQAGGVEVGIREATGSPVQTGFQLWVQPHVIAAENKVILTIIPSAQVLSGTGSTITGFDDFSNGVAKIQLPRVRSSTIVTKLILQDGQTAVLGGLINETTSKEEHKIPFLGDIPALGWAFRWKSDLKTKDNLLVFVTVRIVRNSADHHEIFTRYGDKYGGSTYREMRKEESLLYPDAVKTMPTKTPVAPVAPTTPKKPT